MVLAESCDSTASLGIGRLSLTITRWRLSPPAGSLFISQYVMPATRVIFPNLNARPAALAAEAESQTAILVLSLGGATSLHRRGFAWMEGLILIATLAQRWRLRLVPVIQSRHICHHLANQHGMLMSWKNVKAKARIKTEEGDGN